MPRTLDPAPLIAAILTRILLKNLHMQMRREEALQE